MFAPFLLLIRTIGTCGSQGFTISPENYGDWKTNNDSCTTKHRIGPRIIECLISVQAISNQTCLGLKGFLQFRCENRESKTEQTP